MINKLVPHHSWINLRWHKHLLLLLLWKWHLKVVWEITLPCCHEIGETFWLVHLQSMALAILVASWRMSSTNIFLASNYILEPLNLMALIESFIRRQNWLICLCSWTLKDLRNCCFWVMYACWAFSFPNLLSSKLNLTSFRAFETLICIIQLLIKRQSTSAE